MTQKYERVVWEKGRRGKNGKEPPFLSPVSSRVIFLLALSKFRGLDYLGAWNRLGKV